MRMTRAALRAKASQESLALYEDDDAKQELSTDQEHDARPALKDITEENNALIDATTENLPSSNKTKGKKTISKVKQADQQSEISDMITVDDAAPAEQPGSFHSDSAAHETCIETTVRMQTSTESLDTESETTSPSAPSISGTNPCSLLGVVHSSEIGENREMELPATSQPPRLVPAIEHNTSSMTTNEASLEDPIKTSTPGQLAAEQSTQEEDSFAHKIISRTPRPASRIEDSVEAMDMLEDAIEQFSGELPILDDLRIDSPIKERIVTPSKSPNPMRKAGLSPGSTKKANRPLSESPSKSSSETVPKTLNKSTTTPASRNLAGSTTTKRLSAVKPSTRSLGPNKTVPRVAGLTQKNAAASSRPSTLATRPAASALPNAVKKRVPSDTLSTSRPGFVPAKSSKPATKSTFTLPGEAYAAKMKAQREEKQRKEEEEAAAKRKFKARPAPSAGGRPSVLPRENKASQARLSRVFSGTDKENIEPKVTTSKRPVSMIIDHKKVRTEPNSSVRRAASITSKTSGSTSREPKFAANVPRVASLTSKSAVPKEELAPNVQKKVSGKEVFGRSRLELKKQEDEKREKEEAARKARAEAAERGRQASREWAEKQKAKLAAQKAPKATVQESTAVA